MSLANSPSLPSHRFAQRERMQRLLAPLITALALLGAWECAVHWWHISPRTLPAPSRIGAELLRSANALQDAALTTTYETLTGFMWSIIIGVPLGMALYLSKALYNGMYPLLVAAQTVPLISIAPLFMLWFGFATLGKVIIVVAFGVFPIVVQTSRGLASVPPYFEDVALTCGATRMWTLWHVKLRVAARQIFSGVRLSAAYAFGTAITAEYLGAESGFGIVLQGALNSFRTPLIFAAAVVIVAETGLLLALVSVAEYALLGDGSDEQLD